MLTESTTILCPVINNDTPLEIDLKAILVAEIRQDEVAIVTPGKAPELLSEFNRSWRELHGLYTQLTVEKNKADKVVEQRRAVLILEEVPKVLKEKGLQSNETNREAVISLDEAYQKAQDVSDQIEAIIEYIKGKMKSFDNAFTSVKKILGGSDYNRYRNEHLSGTTENTSAPQVKGFGKAKY